MPGMQPAIEDVENGRQYSGKTLVRKDSSILNFDEKIQLSPAGSSNEVDIDLEARGEEDGYVLDVEVLKTITHRWQRYKLTEDGRTVLIPQPSDDHDDPLNWAWRRNHIVLLVIAATAFLPDYGSAVGAVTLIPQAAQWNTTPDHVNRSASGNVFMLGAGGVITVMLSAYFGRLPVLFWFTLTGLWTAAGSAASKTLPAFVGFRVLHGFFSTVAQGGGAMFIKDMFFVHERTRKLNIWATFFVLSPYFGPLITAFIIDTQDWPWAFWVFTCMTAVCLLAIIFFGEETFFNRSLAPEQRPVRRPGISGHVSRLIGIEQWHSRKQRSTAREAVMRSLRVLAKPTVFITNIYYLLVFAWVVGINTTLSMFLVPVYKFGMKSIGYYYFTPVVAVILGEAVGHWLHDTLAKILTRRNPAGKLEPEYRLMAITVSTPFMVTGIVVLGFALENTWHYMIAAVGWGLYVFGIMITTVALTSYNLDSYPEGSGEIAAWLNMSRTTGGFIIQYFQVDWAKKMGTKATFGIQGAIMFAAYFLVVFVQMYGKKMRERAGPLRFKTD